MAKIRGYAATIYTAAVASMVCNMPVHATGDLLVAFVNKDTSSAFTTPSGWTAQQTVLSAGAAGGVYLKRAASASETVTFTLTSETCCALVIAVKNVNGSTVADAISASAAQGSDDSTLPLTGIGVTPAHNNCLVMHGLSTDSGMGASAYPGWVNLFVGDTAANSLCVSYTGQRTAAAITAPDHWSGLPDDARGVIIAIRDDGNDTEMDAYIAPGTVPAVLVSPLTFSTTPDKGTWELTTNDITTINGKTATQVDAVVAADTGYNPFRASVRQPGISSTTAFSASEMRFTSAVDLTAQNGVLFGTWRFQIPRDYLDTSKVSDGGIILMIADAENDYRAWTIGAQFAKTTKPDSRQNYAIEVNTTDTDYFSSGTLGLSAINDLYLVAAGYYGANSVDWSELYLLNETVLAGGTNTTGLTLDDIVLAVNNGSGFIPLIELSGSAATIWTKIRFGGVDPIHVNCNLNVFQYPRKSDGVDYLDFHVSNDKMGIEFYGLSGDDFVFTNCVFTSASSYYWRFNSSHNSGATLDFSGSSVVKATVTLRSTVTLAGMSFIDCTSFTLNSAVLSDCAFDNTKVTAATLADMADITDTSFVSGGTGYAIEVSGSAAEVTLTGLTFSGYAASNGSTGNEAIYVNIASGTVTLNISGGTTPSIRTAGATVVVNNNVTITLTGLKNPTEVRVFDAGTQTERSGTGAENVTTGSYAFSVPASTSIDISILSLGYQNTRILAYSSASDASIPVSQVLDRQYLNP
jgi:hypothetical protein